MLFRSLLGIALLLVLRRQKFVRAGEIFLSYFIWYSIGRFFIEALRTDSLAFKGSSGLASFLDALWTPMKWLGFEQGYLDPSYGNIRSSQLLALLTILIAVVIIVIRRFTGEPKAHYSDPIVSTKQVSPETVVPESAVNTPKKASQEKQSANRGKKEP